MCARWLRGSLITLIPVRDRSLPNDRHRTFRQAQKESNTKRWQITNDFPAEHYQFNLCLYGASLVMCNRYSMAFLLILRLQNSLHSSAHPNSSAINLQFRFSVLVLQTLLQTVHPRNRFPYHLQKETNRHHPFQPEKVSPIQRL